MAAEKLTKQRFIQIVTMMALLIAAFSYRTVTFDDTEKIFSCSIETVCLVSVDGGAQSIKIEYNLEQSVLEINVPNSLSVFVEGQVLPSGLSKLNGINVRQFPIQLTVNKEDTEIMRIKVTK